MAEPANRLATFQKEFASYLLQSEPRPAASLYRWLPTRPDSDACEARRTASGLRVYRNNVLYSLTQALAAQFPVVQRLVGAEFFGALARDYVQQEPPCEAALTWYGHLFPDFIASHAACSTLPYLADVAALELQCQRVLHAADDAVLDLQQLGAVPQEQLGGLRLFLKAAVSLFAAPYPVDRIWAANVAGSDEEIRLEAGEVCHMLIYRRELEVCVVSLQLPAFLLLQQLQQGKCLQEACAHVAQTHTLQAAELPALLGYLLGLEVFCRHSFAIAEKES
jgi:hypothetical protein